MFRYARSQQPKSLPDLMKRTRSMKSSWRFLLIHKLSSCSREIIIDALNDEECRVWWFKMENLHYVCVLSVFMRPIELQ